MADMSFRPSPDARAIGASPARACDCVWTIGVQQSLELMFGAAHAGNVAHIRRGGEGGGDPGHSRDLGARMAIARLYAKGEVRPPRRGLRSNPGSPSAQPVGGMVVLAMCVWGGVSREGGVVGNALSDIRAGANSQAERSRVWCYGKLTCTKNGVYTNSNARDTPGHNQSCTEVRQQPWAHVCNLGPMVLGILPLTMPRA